MPIICIAGKNEIAINGLELAISLIGKNNVIACPNLSDDGVATWQPSLRRYANEWGVKVLELSDVQEIEEVIFLSLEFDRIVDPKKFKSNRLYNIHFSLLPSYKGVYTSAWPILNGEEYSGVTLHKIDSGIDTGEIISQISFELTYDETARTLYFKYMKYAQELLIKQISNLLTNNFFTVSQSSRKSTYYSKRSIDYQNLKINLNQTAESISREVRAFSFREFQIPKINGISVCNPQITSERSSNKPGVEISNTDEFIEINTIDFNLVLSKDGSFDIHEAVAKKDLNLLKRVCQNKTSCSGIDVFNRLGWTPLMVAVFSGDVMIVKCLLEHGANMRAVNPNGTTLLMYAKDHGEKTGDFSIASLLLDLGVDATVQDRFGKSVYDYVRLNNQFNALKFFGNYDGSI